MGKPRAGRTTMLGVAAALTLIAALAVDVTPAVALRRPRTLAARQPVGAAPVDVSFPIGWVGVVADLAGPRPADGAAGEIRFRSGDGWTAWQPLEHDGAQADGTWTSALVPASRASGYQIRGLGPWARDARAVAINTTDGPLETVGHVPAASAAAAANCRSRADWGADESLRTWAPEFHPAQVLTVHHTATANDDPDPAATVRAIYRYHAVDNGWGDIGYQYLIDEAGVVYEGRWSGKTSRSCLTAGGDGSDFAHDTSDPTDPIVTGAHVGGWNSGNVGVALLGTLSTVDPKPAAVNGLEDLLAGLATRHHLDPQRLDTPYVNPVNGATKTIPTISGHRDWMATECPGDRLYAQLPAIRTAVAARMAGTTPAPADALTTGETTAAGTRTGDHTATHADDGTVEKITEVLSGGPAKKRYSYLDQRWTFDVAGGTSVTSVTLLADVAASASPDGDGYRFAWSTDNATWKTMFTVAAGTGGQRTFALPSTLTGRVYVRAVDTDRTAGRRSLDSVSVDWLAIRSA